MGLPMSSVSSQRQLVAMRAQQFGEAQQHLLALLSAPARDQSPRSKAARAAGHGGIDVRRIASGDLRQHAGRRWG